MSDQNNIWDVIIIGGGPAGVTAAIYSGRALLKTLIIERGQMGGNIQYTERIENYPGFPGGVESFELALKFRDHASEFGATIENAGAQSLQTDGDYKVVTTDRGAFKGKAVIITTGLTQKKLGLKGESEFWGRGVSACATCDGPFYRDIPVAVIGGGNAAVEEAIYLTRFASEVHIVHRRDQLRASKLIQERAFKESKIKMEWNSVPKEIYGSDVVEGMLIEDAKTHETRKLAVSGVFIFVGLNPMGDFAGATIERDGEGYIKVDKDMRTNAPGIFAAGDVVNPVYRQVVIAAGEGARAAIAAEKYIAEHWS